MDVWMPIRKRNYASIARGGVNTVRSNTAGDVSPLRNPDGWHGECAYDLSEGKDMLWTIFVILLVLWLLGLVTAYTLGGFIHILLVIAIAVALIQIICGRRTA